MDVGERLRLLRQEKGMTLAEVSSKSGVAQATLSRIENGHMTGTIKSHMRICEALGINLIDLYGSLDAERSDFAAATEEMKQKDVFVHDEKSISIILTTQIFSKKMLPVMIRLAPEGKTAKEQAKEGTEKFLYCLSGTIKIAVGVNEYALNPGDRLYFNASLPHAIENTGKSEAKCLAVSSPPAL